MFVGHLFGHIDKKQTKAQGIKSHSNGRPNSRRVFGVIEGFGLKQIANEILSPVKSDGVFVVQGAARVKIGAHTNEAHREDKA